MNGLRTRRLLRLSNDSNFYITVIIRPFLLQQKQIQSRTVVVANGTRCVPFDNYGQMGRCPWKSEYIEGQIRSGGSFSELSDEGLEDLFGDQAFVPGGIGKNDTVCPNLPRNIRHRCHFNHPVDGRRLQATLRSGNRVRFLNTDSIRESFTQKNILINSIQSHHYVFVAFVVT